jgi:hypothetical protein
MLTSHMVDRVRLGSIKAAHGRIHSLNSSSDSFQRPPGPSLSYVSVALALTGSSTLILDGSNNQGKFFWCRSAHLTLSFLAKIVLGATRSIRTLESRTSRTSIIEFRRQVMRLLGYCSACRTENIKSSRRSEVGQYIVVVRFRGEKKRALEITYSW